MVAPLMVLNLIMYLVVIGFASWNLNHFINGQTNYPGTFAWFLVFPLAGWSLISLYVVIMPGACFLN